MYNQTFAQTKNRGFRGLPVAIRTIIAVNVAVFLIVWLGGLIFGPSFKHFIINWFAFVPNILTTVTQPWRLVTYMFLHAGFLHILFNMLWLWWMGRAVEEALGPRTLCAVYFGAGIGGALIDIALAQFLGVGSIIGASGAVFGVMVAFATLYPNMRIWFFFFSIRAKYVVGGLIVLNIFTLGGGNVAHGVHLGGALIGFLLIEWDQKGGQIDRPIRFIERWWYKLQKLWEHKQFSTGNDNMYSVSDVEVVEENQADETELDEILEKISEKGYDGLTQEEKKKLFELSDNE